MWNRDTVHDWFINLFAITEHPSDEHPWYTSTYLCTIYASDAAAEPLPPFAFKLQKGLAQFTGASIHAAVWPPEDEAPRWWDQQP